LSIKGERDRHAERKSCGELMCCRAVRPTDVASVQERPASADARRGSDRLQDDARCPERQTPMPTILRKAATRKRSGVPRSTGAGRALTLDEALIAVMIAAVDANRHVSAAEGARAHNIIWSTRRFRERSGDQVNRLIDRVRERIEARGAAVVMDQAARAIPVPVRPAAFAVAADLVLADGTLEQAERRFLDNLSAKLGVARSLSRQILSVIQLKNSV
jgi:tellurite resistance protein